MNYTATASDLSQLAEQLRDPDGIVRQRARQRLMAVGRASTSIFLAALAGERQTRWEGAKGLSKLGDPSTAPQLVELLHDEDHGIRWLAAEGLIHLGKTGLVPLLRELESHPMSDGLREGAHHILHALICDPALSAVLEPVHNAIGGDYATQLGVPLAAMNALEHLSA